MAFEATFYLDLLQVVACLKSKDTDSFYQLGTYNYGASPLVKENRFILGTQEAGAFLHEVYNSKKLLDDGLINQFLINPLFVKLGINPLEFKDMEIPRMEFSAIPDGTSLPAEIPYLGFKTSYFFLARVAIAMDRIYEFQYGIFKSCLPLIALSKKVEAQTGGKPKFINESTTRSYSTTLSAYTAKILELAQIRRSIDSSVHSKNEKYTLANKTEWQITSNGLVDSINSDVNRKLLEKSIGEKFADDLISDGIYYMREEDFLNYHLQGFALSGGLTNTFSIDGSVKNIFGNIEKANSDDYIIDSRYQIVYNSHILSSSAHYGIKGKSLPSELGKYQHCDKMRAYRGVIPKISVDHEDQINEVIDAVQKMHPNKDIYFRGQSSHYGLKRSATSNLFLYGDENIEELSMPTAASRTSFDFDKFIAKFQLQLQGMIYNGFDNDSFNHYQKNWMLWNNQSPFVDSVLNEKHEKFRKLFYSYEWDLMAMAIAQHYGISTHGLDITTDLNIAHWFALNQWYSYNQNGKKYQWYKSREKSKTGKINDNPVIYILAVEKGLKRDLDQVDYINIQALRPLRQNAFLHYGGWGLHNNICAQDVVASVFLNSNYKVNEKIPTDYLFPSTNEDYTYRELLKIQDRAEKLGLKDGYQYIARYKPENADKP